ncbi:MAG: ramA 4 [Glaciihabitans sp.]|nr:ramA 4 [Glaciihabitans sp.]
MSSSPISADAQPWGPRNELTPILARSANGNLRVESNGSAGCYGGWDVPFSLEDQLRHLLVSVRVRWADLQRGPASLEAMALWVRPDMTTHSWAPLEVTEQDGDWSTMRSRVLERPAGCKLIVRVQIRWSSTGWSEWADWRVDQASAPDALPMRLAAGSSKTTGPTPSITRNRDRFLELCRRAGDDNVDLLCLPETIFSQDLGEPSGQGLVEQAVEIPGEHIAPFLSLAKEYEMALAFSVLERSGELVYNTALLIDARGNIALKYRKVHLAIREAWRGVTPGDSFHAARLEPLGAHVGLNICMDSSSPESARLVAAAGAEILLLPIENDFRATAWRATPEESAPFSLPRWSVIQQSRALDNHMYVVAARNAGVGSGIFGPDGTVLAMDYGDSPLVTADVDLHDLRRHPTGPPYRDVIWYQRRPEVYADLVARAATYAPGETRN